MCKVNPCVIRVGFLSRLRRFLKIMKLVLLAFTWILHRYWQTKIFRISSYKAPNFLNLVMTSNSFYVSNVLLVAISTASTTIFGPRLLLIIHTGAKLLEANNKFLGLVISNNGQPKRLITPRNNISAVDIRY